MFESKKTLEYYVAMLEGIEPERKAQFIKSVHELYDKKITSLIDLKIYAVTMSDLNEIVNNLE